MFKTKHAFACLRREGRGVWQGGGGGGHTWRRTLRQWRPVRGLRAHTRSRARASHGGHRPARRRSLGDKNALHRENPAPPHQAGMPQRQAEAYNASRRRHASATCSWRLAAAAAAGGRIASSAPLWRCSRRVRRYSSLLRTRLKALFYFRRSRNLYCVAGLTSAIRISRPRQQSVAPWPAQPRWCVRVWRLFWINKFSYMVKTWRNYSVIILITTFVRFVKFIDVRWK